MSRPPHDLVVFGATGFVGRILARVLADRFGVDGGLRWALAGRSAARLESLRDELGAAARGLPLLVADAADPAALDRLVADTRVVATTVGPYARHGEPLVRACVAAGTDYCDLAGEVPWIRRMIDTYGSAARASGARIVHCCGFDSVPSDLGVHVLQQAALREFGRACTRISMRVQGARGGVSGGTAASLLGVMESAADPAVRRLLLDPYALCPEAARPATRQPVCERAAYDAGCRGWVAPFVMAPINTRVVQRSHALLGRPWGDAFTYDEAVRTGRGLAGRLRATALAIGLGAFLAAARRAPTRALVRRWLPSPGQGPSPHVQATGFFDLRFAGTTDDGRRLGLRVTGAGDPGYASTARMLAEAAACLALDIRRADVPGGFWTPATALGDRLVARLVSHAGMTFDPVAVPA